MRNCILFFLIFLQSSIGVSLNTRGHFTPVCEQIYFSNAAFLSTNVCDAIVEAKAEAEGFPRAGLILTHDATVSDGTFITYRESLANKALLFPVNTLLHEIAWVNNNTGLGAFTFKFYKNGTTVGDLVYTYTPTTTDRTVGYGFFDFPSAILYNAGDILYIEYDRPSGTALSDLALTLWIARTD